MFSRGRRIIEPELLDEAPPEEAERSLRDLRLINRVFGGQEAVRKAFRELPRQNGRLTVLDVGAASGDMGDAIRSVLPSARIISLDYKLSHLSSASPPRVCGNAFMLPFGPRSVDVVFCSLFLHHFEDPEIVGLLRGFSAIARRAIVVTDLERRRLAYYALPLTQWLFRWHPITMHDGPISVAAAFRPAELRDLAGRAGLRDIRVRVYRPAFRIALIAQPAS